MKTDRALLIPLAIAMVVIPAPGTAGQTTTETEAVETLPSAREVIDRYVAAIGGEDTILGRSSLRISGQVEIPSAGLRGEAKIVLKAPNKMLVEIRLDNGMSIGEGFDGDNAWQLNPMTGPAILEDPERVAWIKTESNFYRQLHRPSDVRSMKIVGRTEFEGSTCYELVFTTPDGLVYQEYFDVDSGLLSGWKVELLASGKQIRVVRVLSDYRDFAGFKLPSRMRTRQGPLDQLFSVTDARWGGVEESEVAPPEAITALLRAKNTGP